MKKTTSICIFDLMKVFLVSIVLISCSFTSNAQAIAEAYKAEFGLDGYFSIGNQGGNFAVGAKFGVLKREDEDNNNKLVVGPSARWMRVWSKNFASGGSPVNYNVVGAGAFVHKRVFDALYLAAEIEALKTPTQIVIVNQQRLWVPVLFLGGGYSKSIDERFRVNIGILYDVINSGYSPYRSSYLTRKKVGPNGELGALIPVLYRLELIISLN
jgi:hypothetical protein